MPESLDWFDDNVVFVEQGLRAWAMADTYLVALIGDRWFGPMLPAGVDLPAVTVQLISSIDESPTHQGHSGLERARLQVTVWSACWTRAIQISERIKRRIDNLTGTLGGIPVGRVAVVGTIDQGRESGRNVYQRSIDLVIWYRVNL